MLDEARLHGESEVVSERKVIWDLHKGYQVVAR
jgi:hypothetical protein